MSYWPQSLTLSDRSSVGLLQKTYRIKAGQYLQTLTLLQGIAVHGGLRTLIVASIAKNDRKNNARRTSLPLRGRTSNNTNCPRRHTHTTLNPCCPPRKSAGAWCDPRRLRCLLATPEPVIATPAWTVLKGPGQLKVERLPPFCAVAVRATFWRQCHVSSCTPHNARWRTRTARSLQALRNFRFADITYTSYRSRLDAQVE